MVISGDVQAEPDYRATAETRRRPGRAVRAAVGGRPPVGRASTWRTHATNAFDADDARLVRTVADQVSAALRSARLYASVEQAYLDTAEALASALEAKDSYTAQHSQSIADNAEAVGRVLGMDPAEVRMLRFGAAFHDIGKLAIPGGDPEQARPADRRGARPASSSTR